MKHAESKFFPEKFKFHQARLPQCAPRMPGGGIEQIQRFYRYSSYLVIELDSQFELDLP